MPGLANMYVPVRPHKTSSASACQECCRYCYVSASSSKGGRLDSGHGRRSFGPLGAAAAPAANARRLRPAARPLHGRSLRSTERQELFGAERLGHPGRGRRVAPHVLRALRRQARLPAGHLRRGGPRAARGRPRRVRRRRRRRQLARAGRRRARGDRCQPRRRAHRHQDLDRRVADGRRARLAPPRAHPHARRPLRQPGTCRGARGRLASPKLAEATVGSVFSILWSWVARGELDSLPDRLPDLVYMALAPFIGPREAADHALAIRP